ncbi:MAG: hypothetical protein C0407_08420 [Desulfobacca sp.]|nr:hypothetical protein [Desulfobacca sp.]
MSKFWKTTLLFPLSPSICKVQPCKILFFSEDPPCLPTRFFSLIFHFFFAKLFSSIIPLLIKEYSKIQKTR